MLQTKTYMITFDVSKKEVSPEKICRWLAWIFPNFISLTSAAEHLRAPAQSELKCPTCEVGKLEKVFQCDYCFQVFDEADISERSDGG